jgi:GTP cyclohydrolase II
MGDIDGGQLSVAWSASPVDGAAQRVEYLWRAHAEIASIDLEVPCDRGRMRFHRRGLVVTSRHSNISPRTGGDLTTASQNDIGVQHWLTRKGGKLRVQVVELPGGRAEGYLLVLGRLVADPLVRIHSRCLYGDTLGSEDCDCGGQLEMSMDRMQDEDSGVLLYLEQEGRGAGLLGKAEGYRESERTGADTFTSYENLGRPADLRSYVSAAAALVGLGLTGVRLLTNNPDKVRDVQRAGIVVTCVPVVVPPRAPRARAYLEAKRLRGHMIPEDLLTSRVENEPRVDGLSRAVVGMGDVWRGGDGSVPMSAAELKGQAEPPSPQMLSIPHLALPRDPDVVVLREAGFEISGPDLDTGPSPR